MSLHDPKVVSQVERVASYAHRRLADVAGEPINVALIIWTETQVQVCASDASQADAILAELAVPNSGSEA